VSRERIYYMNLGPWPGYVGFTTSPDAFAREMRRLKISDADGFIKNAHSNATTHFLSNHGSNLAIICIQPFSRRVSKEQYAALIAHEAVHVVQEMRSNLGDLGSEAEAYLVQQMVQEGLQQAWKTGRVARREPRQ
jgi:hypothetical protein